MQVKGSHKNDDLSLAGVVLLLQKFDHNLKQNK